MKRIKIKVIDSSVLFPGDELLKPFDPSIPFPERTLTRAKLVDCTYKGFGGSCQIPNGYTIVLSQWLRQNEDQNENWCE